jgi:hypothetical protein
MRIIALILAMIIATGQSLGPGRSSSIATGTLYPVTIPGDATANLSLEQTTGWTTDASSDISPNPPCAYAIVPTGGGGSTMTLQTTGCANLYTGWMAKKTVSTTAGQLNFLLRASYTFTSVTGIQAWEVGRRATNNAGVTDNGQTQLVPISGSLLEFDVVPSPSGGWADTGCRFPTFTATTTYNEELYWTSTTAGALSLQYVSLNGTLCIIPTANQNVAGVVMSPPWSANEMVVAFQPDAKNLATPVPYNAVVTMSAWTW